MTHRGRSRGMHSPGARGGRGQRPPRLARMEWILAAFAVVLLACAAILASGRWGSMPPVVDDRHPGRIPAGALDAEALRSVRFEVVPRGYSMQQVDDLLDRLAAQLSPAADGVPEELPIPDATTQPRPIDARPAADDLGATGIPEASTELGARADAKAPADPGADAAVAATAGPDIWRRPSAEG